MREAPQDSPRKQAERQGRLDSEEGPEVVLERAFDDARIHSSKYPLATLRPSGKVVLLHAPAYLFSELGLDSHGHGLCRMEPGTVEDSVRAM